MITIKACLTFALVILGVVNAGSSTIATPKTGSTTAASISSGSSVSNSNITTENHNITTTTLSPAQQLLFDLGSDAAGFKKLEDSISGGGGGSAAPAAAPAPAPPAPKKQLSIGNPKAEMSAAEKSKLAAQKQVAEVAQKMAEIEKLNLMNSPSAPKESKPSNPAPAAQYNSDSLPSSSSGDSTSNNAKIIGSAVGGSLAGVAMLVGAVFAIVHAKRKRNKKSEDDIKNDIADEANYGGVDDDLE